MDWSGSVRSQPSPATYATSTVSNGLAGRKRQCSSAGCKIANVVRTFPYSWFLILTYLHPFFRN